MHTYANNNNRTVVLEVSNKCLSASKTIEITTIGLNDLLTAESVDVYPNPTQGLLTITLPSNMDAGQLSINSIDGKEVYARQLNNASNKVTVDISNLQVGIYFLKMQVENQVITKKIILTNE